ncbi:hypothetical protein [Malacoplasma iowae]|uniref:hypothetical protein n=1 Tax=Malacoplasma iowae TaxID=2116 RepID=UPI002A189692|nr:hypothetical protein [Malacoplasma iowae]WPL40370.1 hypothetical protein QX183_02350 [Malacoplasma iowae]
MKQIVPIMYFFFFYNNVIDVKCFIDNGQIYYKISQKEQPILKIYKTVKSENGLYEIADFSKTTSIWV